ncbi:MAG: pca operon transcription factor PcaQ [Alphaproteobacteria bacterium]|jgi:LysR family transcriptional regulator, pca operon transcriptional activator|nr:pca operon transcription factor PcaQ [Alphaproteobacteria bacterium]
MAVRSIDARIKLRHLVCFLEVVQQKSVVRAADALNMSQPAATKTIQELEEVLGVKLFDRSRRNLFLSPAGEQFQRHATSAITALKQGVDAVRITETDNIVRVGALPTASARILPLAVQRFCRDSNARARITTGPNAYLLSLLRAGELDLVIGRMSEPGEIAGLSFEHLYAEKVGFVVRANHPLLALERFSLSAIAAYQLLMPPAGSVIRPSVERLLVGHGVTEIRDDIETVSNAFGRRYVLVTDAVWIISEGVVADDVAEGQLALLPVDTSETLGPVGLTMRSGEAVGFHTQMLVAAIRAVAAERTGA